MSGIYIKGMEMPKKCISCPFCSYGLCVANKGKELGSIQRRDDDCPLVPVPDHGRLGDLDELYRRLYAEERVMDKPYIDYLGLVVEAQTIIPADKEGEA